VSRAVNVLDFVHSQPCGECRGALFVVDGDGEGKFWLLCMDVNKKGCVHTKPLDEDLVVEE